MVDVNAAGVEAFVSEILDGTRLAFRCLLPDLH
jgi:hypothetical protein